MPEPTTPLDLTGLRKLAEAATPGPWTAHDDGLVWPERMGDPVSGSEQLADAEFIAAARTAVPALLAELNEREWQHVAIVEQWETENRRLLAALAEAQRERDELRQEFADVGWSSVAALHAAYLDVLERWQRGEPLVEAALDFSRNQSRLWPLMDAAGQYRAATQAAVDTYETQEGTDA